MSNQKISIIIASRNARKDLEKCLTSIFANHGKEEIEVIVSDNGSTDGTCDMISESFSWIKVSRSEHGGSYASAINRGIKSATGQYFLLLDSDAIIKKDTLHALLEFHNSQPKAGAVVCKMLYPDGSVQLMARKFPSPINSIFGRESLLTKIFPKNKISSNYLMLDDIHNEDEPFTVDWASAACMMIKKEAIEQVGTLDEGFLLYWVDTDWCRRAGEHGWKIYCLPRTTIIHDMRNNPGKKKSFFMIKAFHKGAYLYFRKSYMMPPFHPLNLIAFCGLSGRAILQLLLNFLKSA